MRYVHDKPEPVYEPRKWVKPSTEKPSTEKPSTEKQNPNQLSLFNEPKNVNKVEIEKLDKQIDSLEDEWDKLWNEDQKKNKMDLEEIDAVIKSLVLKRDELEFGSPLPF
jgi:hypothetical protein